MIRAYRTEVAVRRGENEPRPISEFIEEMKAASASLVTAAGAAETGDLAAAEIGVENALFRVQSLLGRIRQAQIDAEFAPPPTTPGAGQK